MEKRNRKKSQEGDDRGKDYLDIIRKSLKDEIEAVQKVS
jgi:uncharacterized protein YnzC (UPF0291/DUF896 family)